MKAINAITSLALLLAWCFAFVAFIRMWDSMSIMQAGLYMFGLLCLFGITNAKAKGK